MFSTYNQNPPTTIYSTTSSWTNNPTNYPVIISSPGWSTTSGQFDVVRQLDERARKVKKLVEEWKKLTRVFKRKLFPGLFARALPELIPQQPVFRTPVLLLRARGQAPRKAR